jgi:carbamoyl-phosphate synthase large subunit
MNIVDVENPDGVIVQFGGQTPLNLSLPLKRLGVPIIGTDPENIDLAEDRKRFGKLLDDLKIPSPPNGTATSEQEAVDVARRLGFPVLVRPSYVLGGRAMVIAYEEETVRRLHARGGDLFGVAAGADRSLPRRTPPRWMSMRCAMART